MAFPADACNEDASESEKKVPNLHRMAALRICRFHCGRLLATMLVL